MSANDCLILAIGPAFSDILLQLEDNQYNLIKDALFPKDSTWIRLDDQFGLSTFLNMLGIANPTSYMEGGSTILGTLSTMPIDIRERTIIFTYEGIDNKGLNMQSLKQYVKAVCKLGIKLRIKAVRGANLIGVVIVSNKNRERLLMTHSDYNISFIDDVDIPSAEYLLINCYEMLDISENNPIFRLIESKNYKVVLGLGSQNIINGELKKRIVRYCKNGFIYCLSGNYSEFQELHSCNIQSIRNEDVFTSIPYILITQGKDGMIGYSPDCQHYQPAYFVNESEIKSTSGAGDIALGVFLSGIINNENLPNILSRAAYKSSLIIRRLSNVFQEGSGCVQK